MKLKDDMWWSCRETLVSKAWETSTTMVTVLTYFMQSNQHPFLISAYFNSPDLSAIENACDNAF